MPSVKELIQKLKDDIQRKKRERAEKKAEQEKNIVRDHRGRRVITVKKGKDIIRP